MVFFVVSLTSCKDIGNNSPKKIVTKKVIKKETKKEKKPFLLTDKNAIPFFYEYEKNNKESVVRILTDYGNIDIKLFTNTPFH